ncbi:uncharacterized protein EV154DRAFT_383990, partial [Mucor mucedo]|uniref:uncharacterized protein n=1 Tax=Mucor mucedo TaxID=29922 RepID=UPI0022208C4E
EEEYEIETIVSHRLYRSAVVSYEVQWKGYSAEENTVEKADSLHNDVADLCAAYWDSLTDTPRPINAPASRNNSSQTTPSKGNAASSSLKRVKNGESSESHKKTKFDLEHVPQYMTERGFSYPKTWPNLKTKWETDMVKLRAVQLSPIDKNIKMAYIEWKNGDKTIHTLDECHKKCPEKASGFF